MTQYMTPPPKKKLTPLPELVTVPSKPTEEMIIAAAGKNYCGEDVDNINREWDRMVRAYLKTQVD